MRYARPSLLALFTDPDKRAEVCAWAMVGVLALHAFGIFFGQSLGEIGIALTLVLGLLSPDFYKAKPWRDPLVLLMLVTGLWLIASTLLAPYANPKLDLALAWLRLVFFVAVVLFVFRSRPKLIPWLYAAIFAVVCFMMLDGLVQLLLGYDLFGFAQKNPYRITGPLPRFRYGTYLGMLAPFGLLYLLNHAKFPRQRWEVLSVLAFLLVLNVCILLSGQRIYFAIYLVLTAAFLLWYQRRQALLTLALVGLCLAGLLVAFPHYQQRFVDRSLAEIGDICNDLRVPNFEQDSVGGYGTHMRRGIEAFAARPLTGNGMRSLPAYCQAEVTLPEGRQWQQIGCSTHPHNNWVAWASYAGIPGLLMWAALCLYVVWTNWRLWRSQDRRLQVHALASLWVLFPYAQPLFLAYDLFANAIEVVFWYALPLAWLGVYPLQPDKTAPWSPQSSAAPLKH